MVDAFRYPLQARTLGFPCTSMYAAPTRGAFPNADEGVNESQVFSTFSGDAFGGTQPNQDHSTKLEREIDRLWRTLGGVVNCHGWLPFAVFPACTRAMMYAGRVMKTEKRKRLR